MKLIHFIAIFIILFHCVEHKKLQKSFEEIFGDGWHLKTLGEKETNLAQIMARENEQQKINEENDQQRKREIIRKFRKEEEANLAQIMAQENEQQNEPNHAIIDGTDQNEEEENGENDQQRKREIIRKFHISEEQKREIVREFQSIKEIIKQKGKRSKSEWAKIEHLLAKKLGKNRTTIYKWIKALGMQMKKHFTEEQKSEIVQEFQTIKKRIRQKGRKYSSAQWNKIEHLLGKKLGTNRFYIYKWISELGMGQRKMHSKEEKLAILRKYWEMKRNDSKMSDEKIVKALKIGRETIRRWKGQFGGGGEEAI